MPFLAVTKMTRVLELSHWGNIAVEETIEIVHNGAILKGSFSRFDFQRDQRGHDRQPCVKSFKVTFFVCNIKFPGLKTKHLKRKKFVLKFIF